MSNTEFKKSDHLLGLKVLKLTQPQLASPVIVTCDAKDLPGKLYNGHVKSDVTTVEGNETIGASQFMVIPQSIRNIYLGETFSCYICINNKSQQAVQNVTLKVDLQTNRLERIPLCVPGKDIQAKSLEPKDTLDFVIQHEVKEIDTHRLICEVSYVATMNGVPTPLTLQEYFVFNVLKPLDLKTRFYTAESDEVYLEAQVQNITSGPISLENVSLEASPGYKVTVLNCTDDGQSVFGKINSIPQNASRQYLYSLSPNPTAANVTATSLGNLNFVWRSEMGEKGRIQTSDLHKPFTEVPDLRLCVQELPNLVYIDEPFQFKIKLTNTSFKPMDLSLYLENLLSMSWIGVSGRKIGTLESKSEIILALSLVPLMTGLQTISGIRIKDSMTKKNVFENDNLAQIYVLQRQHLEDSVA
ncbi:trafficking protein particle complex subunit 13 isoform X2 [Diaphorina citri]|uniref:Trafficking protein particle complex subunit 13 isoform X1 n=1 Tax=Diaphorina citri TaxID=121845 RepID=A0A1S3DQ49_DIACI|nr:trafficking protein particle complex subunit 13 isoform X1 [Diaphorina citri]XP_008485316.1 trafficking protein particle complex subunit 13 isoform X2 [Diaphorina citri]